MDKDDVYDRRMTVDIRRSTIYAEVDDPFSSRIYGFARVWQAKSQRIVVEFPRALLGKGVDDYRYYWETAYHRDSPEATCGSPSDVYVTCLDRVPNRGWIWHRRDTKTQHPASVE